MDYSKLEGVIERKYGKLTKSFPGTDFILWMNYETYCGFNDFIKKRERWVPVFNKKDKCKTKRKFFVKSILTCSGPLDIVVNDKLSEPYVLMARNFASDLLFNMNSIALNERLACNS